MKNAKVIFACLLVIVLLISGCSQKILITTGFNDGELMKMSGKVIKTNEIMLMILNEKQSYEIGLDQDFWSVVYDGKKMTDYLKEQVKDEFIELNILYEFAKSKNVTLSEDEEAYINEKAKEYITSADATTLDKYNIDEKVVKTFMQKVALSDKVYQELIQDYDIEISDEEARVMYVNYITLDSTVENALVVAENIQKEVMSGNDLEKLAGTYENAVYTEGYFSRTNFSEIQSEEVFKLKDGEVSGVIEDNGKLYVIKCINDYDENMTESNKKVLVEQKKTEEFDKEYRPFEKSVNVEFNTEFWNGLDISKCTETIGVDVYDILK